MTNKKSLRLDDRTILRVCWISEFGYDCLEVGRDGITLIDCQDLYCDEYRIWWIQVWKGNKLYARYNARNVDNIAYEEGEDE